MPSTHREYSFQIFPQNLDRLETQLRDYVDGTARLIGQRQAIFLSATLLAGYYFDIVIAVACYGLVQLTELYDLYLARRIMRWKGGGRVQAYRFLAAVAFNTVCSASAICLFAVLIAKQEGVGPHFTPLFFLFAAALFAAMNNHQLVPALFLRLMIYGSAFIFIPLSDVWNQWPPLSSKLWLQFFTSIFVLFFIIDCSRIFLTMYRNRLNQLEDLKAEHERTTAALAAKTEFLSTVSHELRTPLTSIKGTLNLINSGILGAVPSKAASALEIAEKNSNRLADLIDELLDLQKLDAGDMTFDMKPVDLVEVIHDAVSSNMSLAEQFSATMIVEAPETEVIVLGDYKRLFQVVTNLISNAVKFSNTGGRVEILVEQKHHKALVYVRDYGPGIPPGQEEKVFGRFVQLDGSDERKFGGTGLGLHISKKIVNRHGGTILYSSPAEGGTTFNLTFDCLERPGSLATTRDPRIASS